jgi:hypothetical protein
MKYCYIADEYKDAIETLQLRGPDDWMRHAVQVAAQDRTTETRRLKPPAPLPGCYAKIYRYPRWDDRLQIIFRGGLVGRSRARTEFDNLRHLSRYGLAPRVVAYGKQRKYGFLSVSLLVIEEVAQTQAMDTFVGRHLAGLTRRQRLNFIDALARFAQKMNADGFVNSEFHWRNILVRQTGESFAFWVIDPSSRRLRYRVLAPVFDVATLDVCAPWFFTRAERLRFMKVYWNCAESPLTDRHKKHLRTIAAIRNTIAKKELNRYRTILPPTHKTP